MVDLIRRRISARELVEEFIDCYGTVDKKSGYLHLHIGDIPFDEQERYAKARIFEDNNNEWAVESSDLYDSILCVVGNELDLDMQEDVIHSIKSQAVDYYYDDLKIDIEKELRDRVPDSPEASIDNEHMTDYKKDRMLASEMVGY